MREIALKTNTMREINGRFTKSGKLNRQKHMRKVNDDKQIDITTLSQPVITSEVDSSESLLASIPDTRSSDTCETENWKCGRRIVELDHMAEQLSSCVDCDQTLNLKNIVDEKRRGFGSVLTLQCSCGMLNTVTTNKAHRVGSRGPPIFDLNTKAALGMYYIIYFPLLPNP